MQSRRDPLNKIQVNMADHAGLWFDKYLSQQLPQGASVGPDQKTPQQKLVEECAGISEPDGYKAFFERWQSTLHSFGAKQKEAKVQGRLAVGLGDESVIETAVTLHHTYGVPYIPGSALKGLAANFAHQRLNDDTWRKGGKGHTVLFGSTEEAGFITFFDALYVPGSGVNGQVLQPDVITIHHQEYYQGGKSAPTEWDNPNPVSFLSAAGKYLIALAGPDDEWTNTAFSILGQALQDAGVGAKTSSSYGRLHFDPHLGIDVTLAGEAEEGTTEQKQHPDVERFKQQLAALPNKNVAGGIYAFVERWRTLEIDEPYRQEIACAILLKIREANREKKSKKKAWYQELLASLPDSMEC